MIIPDWFQTELSRLRGSSIYGDPILRVVFGPEQRAWDGRYKYLNPNGGPMECWILERWQPAGFFGSREKWEASDRFYDDVKQRWTNLKGPFPERGGYTMVCPLLGNDGRFVPLDETVMRGIRLKIRQDEEFASLNTDARNFLVMQQHTDARKAQTDELDRNQEFIREHALKNWDRESRSTSRAYNFTPR